MADLRIYQEIALLALKDEEGIYRPVHVEHLTAGAILSELLIEGRARVSDSRKQLVHLEDRSPSTDPILNTAIEIMAGARRPKRLMAWVIRVATIGQLRQRVAEQLVADGILRRDERQGLVFKRKLYPQINPMPEQAIIERMRQAIFYESGEMAPRTAALIALAEAGDLLRHYFPREMLKGQAARLTAIREGQVVGEATPEALASIQTAAVVTAVLSG